MNPTGGSVPLAMRRLKSPALANPIRDRAAADEIVIHGVRHAARRPRG
jgi:hypothetical protein